MAECAWEYGEGQQQQAAVIPTSVCLRHDIALLVVEFCLRTLEYEEPTGKVRAADSRQYAEHIRYVLGIGRAEEIALWQDVKFAEHNPANHDEPDENEYDLLYFH